MKLGRILQLNFFIQDNLYSAIEWPWTIIDIGDTMIHHPIFQKVGKLVLF